MTISAVRDIRSCARGARRAYVRIESGSSGLPDVPRLLGGFGGVPTCKCRANGSHASDGWGHVVQVARGCTRGTRTHLRSPLRHRWHPLRSCEQRCLRAGSTQRRTQAETWRRAEHHGARTRGGESTPCPRAERGTRGGSSVGESRPCGGIAHSFVVQPTSHAVSLEFGRARPLTPRQLVQSAPPRPGMRLAPRRDPARRPVASRRAAVAGSAAGGELLPDPSLRPPPSRAARSARLALAHPPSTASIAAERRFVDWNARELASMNSGGARGGYDSD